MIEKLQRNRNSAKEADSHRIGATAAEQAGELLYRGTQVIHDLFDGLLNRAQEGVLCARSYLRLTARRIRRASHEKKAKRFPESDSWPVRVFLMASGVLPLLRRHLRKEAWLLRCRLNEWKAERFNRAHKRLLHPLAFAGAGAAVAALALFFSSYTIGATVTYDGNVVASTTSLSAVKEACANIEAATATTLGSTYTIDSDLLHYSPSLVARNEVVDESALEAELSNEIGLVTYAYALYVDGELVGATPYEGALEELLPLCEKEGVGVVPYQLLQGGMLTGKYRRGQEAPAGSRLAEKPEWMKPFTDETYDVIERCAAEAAAEGVTMTQHALRWALAQPGVVSALVGVKREEQIDEAAGAVR